MAIYASQARKGLFALIKRVNADRAPAEIVTRRGDRAYLVPAEDFESMLETNHLLQSPANGERLREALADVRAGRNLLTPPASQVGALQAPGTTEAALK